MISYLLTHALAIACGFIICRLNDRQWIVSWYEKKPASFVDWLLGEKAKRRGLK